MDSDKLLHSFGDDDNSPYKHERDFSIEDILNKSDLKHQGHSFGFDDDLDLEEAIEKKYFPDESIEHMGEADSAFLDNVINNKIQGKMQEMKAAKGHTFSETGDKSKFLDYTLDENDVLIKKPRLLEQSKTKTTEKAAEGADAEIKEEDTIQKSNVFDNTQADHEADDSKVQKDGYTITVGEEDEDEGDIEGHESVGTATFKRKSSVPMVDTEEDYSKLIDTSNNAGTANETLPMEANKRRHKSSLSMIDDMHAQKLSKTDFEQFKNLAGLEGPSERNFRAGDISINKTILDGSVIIHTGRNPLEGNGSNHRGTFTGANGYDYDTYYGANQNVMDTQLNISCFDTPNNYSVADNSTPNQAAPNTQGLAKQSSTFGTLDALRKKLKEKKDNETKGITVTVTEPKNERDEEQNRRVPASNETPKQEPTQKQDQRISKIGPSSHSKNNSSMWSTRFGKIGGYTSDIKHSFIYQTTEDDFLNNEWERILNEVEKHVTNDPNTTVKDAQQKREIVTAARKKYLRQLVKGTTVFAKQGIISEANENQKAKKVAIASNMIEYYNGENIGMEGKDNNMSIDEKDMGPANNRTINDVIFSLLLIEKHMMHMNIVSDYEIKKCESIFSNMVTKAKDCHEAYFGLGKILFSKNEISKAAELFELAIRTFERDPVYMLWAAMALYYQYKRCPKHSPRKRELAVKVEDYAVGCIEANKQDLNALFIYLHLVLDLDLNAAVIRLTPRYSAEDVAVWMKQVDNYKGYLAWVEVYLRRGDKRFAAEVLEELIEFYPGNPEAYFRMWSMKKDNPVQAMDVAEKMFLCCTNFYTLETKIAMNLIYSESLFKTQQYIQCFEFLQNEFSKFPIYSVLLYYYGKYISQSGNQAYFGSGIGALQECLRVCIPQRGPFINYYLGEFYRQLERPGKVVKYYTKAKKGFSSYDKDAADNDYFEKHKKFFHTIESTKKIIKTCEGASTIYTVSETKMEKLIPSLNDIKETDPITVCILKSDVYNKVFKDKVKACKELKILMKEFPENEEPYMHYWDLLKELGNQRELDEISVKLQAVCNNSSVPTNSWVNALFKHSEMLVMKDNIEEAIKTLKRICFILPPMPLPRLNYIDKSIKIKDEILDNIRNALQLPEEAEQEPEFEENSLFVDDEPIKGDNTMNESDFMDFRVISGLKNAAGVDSQRPSEINKRVSVYSDYEGNQNDDRSIMMTKKISEVEPIEAPKPTTLDKISSLKNQSPIRRKEEGMTDNSIIQLRKDIGHNDNQANISDFDISNISISRPFMTGRVFDPSRTLGNQSRVNRS